MSDQKPILITGCARTGTSLLTLLMRGFRELDVASSHERNPIHFTSHARRAVIKYPQGRKDPKADFGIPAEWTNPEVCYLRHYLNDWQVIICLRDARDILVSRHHEDLTNYRVSIARCRGALERDLAALTNQNTLAVYYEQLVSDPHAIMREISTFIGEKYDYGLIDTFYQHADPNTQITLAMNGLRRIDTASIGNWRLPEHRARWREIGADYTQYIAPLMPALGYEDTAITHGKNPDSQKLTGFERKR